LLSGIIECEPVSPFTATLVLIHRTGSTHRMLYHARGPATAREDCREVCSNWGGVVQECLPYK
jgi:hypothetical protein